MYNFEWHNLIMCKLKKNIICFFNCSNTAVKKFEKVISIISNYNNVRNARKAAIHIPNFRVSQD